MIVEQRNILTWITFPEAEHLFPHLSRVYLQAAVVRPLWTHQRVAFRSYTLNLHQPPTQLLSNYHRSLRADLKRSQRQHWQIKRHQDPTVLIALLATVNQAKGLSPVTADHFRTKTDFVITEIAHPDLGVLAAHAYLFDRRHKRLKLEYNASAFRRFAKGTHERSLCGLANNHLFHEDFIAFGNQGYHLLDFGGYGNESSTQWYKDKFGGQVVTQHNYYPYWYYWYRKLRAQ